MWSARQNSAGFKFSSELESRLSNAVQKPSKYSIFDSAHKHEGSPAWIDKDTKAHHQHQKSPSSYSKAMPEGDVEASGKRRRFGGVHRAGKGPNPQGDGKGGKNSKGQTEQEPMLQEESQAQEMANNQKVNPQSQSQTRTKGGGQKQGYQKGEGKREKARESNEDSSTQISY